MEELGARPFVIPRRTAPPRNDALTSRFARGLSRALAADRPTGLEWGIAIVGLFLLGRTPMLFIRRRLTDVLGSSTSELWQDDLVVVGTFAVVHVAAIALASRRADIGALGRQKSLFAFCAFAWISTAWSVEPAVTARHSALFAGTAAVGWYLGSRFSLRQQPALVVGSAAVGAIASGVVTTIWPELGIRSRPNYGDLWSGIYVNRNSLALAMSIGLLAAVFLAASSRRGRPVFVGAAAVFLFWVVMSGSRTGPVGLAVTFGICAMVVVLRHYLSQRYAPAVGATYLGAIVVGSAAVLYALLPTITAWLGRDPTLSKRTYIWQLARWFSSFKPWEGWGFDAIWANRRAVGQAQTAYAGTYFGGPTNGRVGSWPFSAHNGFYETLIGLGRIGLLLLVCFLAIALWRAFRYAWARSDVMSLWPFALIVFAVVVNCSESLFIPNEALWALTIAAAVRVTESARDEGT